MKKQLLIVLAALGSHWAISQETVIKAYVEHTSVCPKTGFSIGLENKHGFEYGCFFQEARVSGTLISGDVTSQLPINYEKEFMGLYGAACVVETNHFDLSINVRTGIINSEYFGLTPSLLGNIHAGSHIRLGAGFGIHSFQPAYQGSLALIL